MSSNLKAHGLDLPSQEVRLAMGPPGNNNTPPGYLQSTGLHGATAIRHETVPQNTTRHNRVWYETGTGVVREWCGSGTSVVRNGTRVVREWYESGTRAKGEWYESGTRDSPPQKLLSSMRHCECHLIRAYCETI